MKSNLMTVGQRVEIRDSAIPGAILSDNQVADGTHLKKYFGIEVGKIRGIIVQVPAEKKDYHKYNCETFESEYDFTFQFDCRVLWDNGYYNSFNFRDLKTV